MSTKSSYIFLISILSLIFGMSSFNKRIVYVELQSPPLSKGCFYPTREVKVSKTELGHFLPYSQIHKCHYNSKKKLIRVSTYDFEQGYQMKKPVREVVYSWSGSKLRKYSIREATFGNGEIDKKVVLLFN